MASGMNSLETIQLASVRTELKHFAGMFDLYIIIIQALIAQTWPWVFKCYCNSYMAQTSKDQF